MLVVNKQYVMMNIIPNIRGFHLIGCEACDSPLRLPWMSDDCAYQSNDLCMSCNVRVNLIIWWELRNCNLLFYHCRETIVKIMGTDAMTQR